MTQVRLVIFDCDGVLVDSEELGCRVLLAAAAVHGYAAPLADAVAWFRGQKMAHCVATIEAGIGRPLPEDFVPGVRARMADAFARELRPVPGVAEVLRRLAVPCCVASSGPREKIELTLGVTGLLPYFDAGRIFTAYEVGRWKPDPGLFLHAAERMGVAPADCAVVEDSVPGVRAGVAAGMRVLGYAATADRVDELAREGPAAVFDTMDALFEMLPCRPAKGRGESASQNVRQPGRR